MHESNTNSQNVTPGQLSAVLTNAGTPIGPYDVMIAGTALARGLILVTANTRVSSSTESNEPLRCRYPPVTPDGQSDE